MFQPSTPESVSAELQARREQIRAGFTRRVRPVTPAQRGGARVARVVRVLQPRSHPPTPAASHSRARAA